MLRPKRKKKEKKKSQKKSHRLGEDHCRPRNMRPGTGQQHGPKSFVWIRCSVSQPLYFSRSAARVKFFLRPACCRASHNETPLTVVRSENSALTVSLPCVLLCPSIFFFFCSLCFPGYVQGMSDLCAPILVVMEDEVDTFWCFAGLMDSVVSEVVLCSLPTYMKADQLFSALSLSLSLSIYLSIYPSLSLSIYPSISDETPRAKCSLPLLSLSYSSTKQISICLSIFLSLTGIKLF